MSNSNQSNQSNVSRETIRTPSSYKVLAVKELAAACNCSLASALAANVAHNWDSNWAHNWASDVECLRTFDNQVSCLQLGDLNMKLYFAPSTAPSNGIGMHMLIVKDNEPTYVLFIGFYEFSIISQIVASLEQMKLVRGMDECRESKTRQWAMSNVDKLSHRIVTCLFGSDLKELYNLI